MKFVLSFEFINRMFECRLELFVEVSDLKIKGRCGLRTNFPPNKAREFVLANKEMAIWR